MSRISILKVPADIRPIFVHRAQQHGINLYEDKGFKDAFRFNTVHTDTILKILKELNHYINMDKKNKTFVKYQKKTCSIK